MATEITLPVGLLRGDVAVSDISSSPTLKTFRGVRGSRPSDPELELELSLDNFLLPRLCRGVEKSDSMSSGVSFGVGVGVL